VGTCRHDDSYIRCWEWVHDVMVTAIVGVGSGYMSS